MFPTIVGPVWMPTRILLAISQGLSRNFRNDQEVLGQGFVIYDALYSWVRKQPAQTAGSGLDRLLALMSDWAERSRQRRQLQELDDWLLEDLGITRREADAEAHKSFWIP